MPANVVGWIRVYVPRYTAKGQWDAMLAHNVTKAFQGSAIREDDVPKGLAVVRGELPDLLRHVENRKDGVRFVVAVLHTHLLTDYSLRGVRGAVRRDFFKALDGIEAEKAVIWELYTGRRTDKRADREAMIRDAVEAIAVGRHKTRVSDKRGRPEKEFSDDEWAQASRAWESRRLRRWQDVKAKLPKGMTLRRAWERFGPRDAEEA